MTEFEIAVAGEQAQLLSSRGQLTYRMAGAKLHFSFDGEWDGLTPVALVRQGDAAVAVPMETDTAIIPGHALTMVGDFVYAGVYGVSADGLVAIPTVWVRLGRLRDGAHIFYDEDTLPNTPIWQTMGEQLGDLSRLQTPEKTNLVDAVNSLSADSLGAISAPETGVPGQVLVVGSADAAGKPVFWKTADMPEQETVLPVPWMQDFERMGTATLLQECQRWIIKQTDDGASIGDKQYKQVFCTCVMKAGESSTAVNASGIFWVNHTAGNQALGIGNIHHAGGTRTQRFYGAAQNGTKYYRVFSGAAECLFQGSENTHVYQIVLDTNSSANLWGVGSTVEIWGKA